MEVFPEKLGDDFGNANECVVFDVNSLKYGRGSYVNHLYSIWNIRRRVCLSRVVSNAAEQLWLNQKRSKYKK